MTIGQWKAEFQIKTSAGYVTINDIPVSLQYSGYNNYETLINFNGHTLYAYNNLSTCQTSASFDNKNITFGFTYQEKIK